MFIHSLVVITTFSAFVERITLLTLNCNFVSRMVSDVIFFVKQFRNTSRIYLLQKKPQLKGLQHSVVCLSYFYSISTSQSVDDSDDSDSFEQHVII